MNPVYQRIHLKYQVFFSSAAVVIGALRVNNCFYSVIRVMSVFSAETVKVEESPTLKNYRKLFSEDRVMREKCAAQVTLFLSQICT